MKYNRNLYEMQSDLRPAKYVSRNRPQRSGRHTLASEVIFFYLASFDKGCMNRSLAYNILLSGTLLWCALLFIPPVLATVLPTAPGFSREFYGLFSHICHQYDERSLHVLGHKLGVCGRCAAIYFGFLLGTLLGSKFQVGRPWRGAGAWAVASAPMVLDVVLDGTGLHLSTLTTRLATGGVFGVLAAFLLVPSLVEGIPQLFHMLSKGVDHECET
jgi:uncharacterized membrane protein